ncbi:Hypothetical predicted protein [Paramuricea clavata]|uniref:Uncharacterized protein n=1 Tax=Paramuricea clavata TaxID=317549 RepID=A0A6S7HMH8_PARCT|nr:Hypothetical predicted protein [Paramuricea clavata]
MWSLETSSSKMYKLISVQKNMTTKELIEKVAKLFKLKVGYFSITYSLPQSQDMQIEIEGEDNEGFSTAYHLLPNFSKMKVELKSQSSRGITMQIGNRSIRNKEVVSEEIKREMGLHDDQGRRKRGCINAIWSTKCSDIIECDPRFLLEFDKVQSGLEKAWGSKQYLLNPFQILCPLCDEIRVLPKMNQPEEVIAHIKNCKCSALPSARDIAVKRLEAWKANNFITEQQLDSVAELVPGLFKDPSIITSKPMVRAAVLARGIVEGAV